MGSRYKGKKKKKKTGRGHELPTYLRGKQDVGVRVRELRLFPRVIVDLEGK